MTIKAIVYTLRDENMNVRYVGCTKKVFCPQSRLIEHSSNKHSEVGRWIKAEKDARRSVNMVIEECFSTYGDAHLAEKAYIEGYGRLLGRLLTNRTYRPNASITYAPGVKEQIDRERKSLNIDRPKEPDPEAKAKRLALRKQFCK